MIHFFVCSACCGGAWNFLDSLLLPPQQAAADWECPSQSCKTWVSHYDHAFLFGTTMSVELIIWPSYQCLGLLCKWLRVLSIKGLSKSGMACQSTMYRPEFVWLPMHEKCCCLESDQPPGQAWWWSCPVKGHQNSYFEWLDRKSLLFQFNHSNLDSGRGCISHELIELYVPILTAFTTWLSRSNRRRGGRRPQLGCRRREGHWGSNFACWRGVGEDQGNWRYPLSTKYWSPTSRYCWGWVQPAFWNLSMLLLAWGFVIAFGAVSIARECEPHCW